MSRRSCLILSGLAFLTGTVLGIWLQHRWPLGRLRAAGAPAPSIATLSVAQLASMPADRRLVIVAVGQSNAANYASGRRAAGRGVYAYSDRQLYAAIDPLPGGDGREGSLWTRLAARLMNTGSWDAVVIAVAAQGSTLARDWASGAEPTRRLERVLADLCAAGLSPRWILWQQGESEGRQPSVSAEAYARDLRQVTALCHRLVPQATVIIAQATLHEPDPANEQVRLAQRVVAADPGCAAGPDLDALGAEYRRDGVHFNEGGADRAANLWLDALMRAEPPRP